MGLALEEACLVILHRRTGAIPMVMGRQIVHVVQKFQTLILTIFLAKQYVINRGAVLHVIAIVVWQTILASIMLVAAQAF